MTGDEQTAESQAELLVKLTSVAEQIEAYRATLFMLEFEQAKLRTQLRLTGWQQPEPQREGRE
jgi:hypothetical protein